MSHNDEIRKRLEAAVSDAQRIYLTNQLVTQETTRDLLAHVSSAHTRGLDLAGVTMNRIKAHLEELERRLTEDSV